MTVEPVDFRQPRYLGECHAFVVPSKTKGGSYLLLKNENSWLCSCAAFDQHGTCYHVKAGQRMWPTLDQGEGASHPSHRPLSLVPEDPA